MRTQTLRNPAAVDRMCSEPAGRGTNQVEVTSVLVRAELQAATKLGMCCTRIGGLTSPVQASTICDVGIWAESEAHKGSEVIFSRL